MFRVSYRVRVTGRVRVRVSIRVRLGRMTNISQLPFSVHVACKGCQVREQECCKGYITVRVGDQVCIRAVKWETT